QHSDGANPVAPVVEGSDGAIYGMTSHGGAYDSGTIFRLSPALDFQSLLTFNGANGAVPLGPLTERDGYFYGTTYSWTSEDNSGNGTVFQMSPEGAFANIFYFPADFSYGAYPYMGLTKGADTNLYGLTSLGGENNF